MQIVERFETRALRHNASLRLSFRVRILQIGRRPVTAPQARAGPSPAQLNTSSPYTPLLCSPFCLIDQML